MEAIDHNDILDRWCHGALLRTVFAAASIMALWAGEVRSEIRPEVQALLEQLGSDFQTAEGMAELERGLRQPGITPDLMEALKRDYFIPNPNYLACTLALAALQYRTDLSEVDLATITDELKRCSELPGELPPNQESFACVGLLVLKHYPTSNHEDLALKFLSRERSMVLRSAVETLSVIGSDRSIPVLKEVREKMAQKYPGASVIALLDEAIGAIVSHPGTYVRQQDTYPPINPAKAAPPRDKGSTAKGEEQPPSTPILMWAGLIVAATSLLWWLLKKRK